MYCCSPKDEVPAVRTLEPAKLVPNSSHASRDKTLKGRLCHRQPLRRAPTSNRQEHESPPWLPSTLDRRRQSHGWWPAKQRLLEVQWCLRKPSHLRSVRQGLSAAHHLPEHRAHTPARTISPPTSCPHK